MKKFTFEDYKKALKDAGPKLAENILDRATEDEHLTMKQYMELLVIVYGL